MLTQCCTEHVWTQWPPQMGGVQCGPGNVNMVKTLCIYLLVTWELMLRALLSLGSVLPLPRLGATEVKTRRESRVEVYHDEEAEPRAACTLQFSSAAQSCPTPCDPMDCSTPDLPVHHQLPEFTQTHIQPFHPLSSPPPPAFNLSQHQDLFQ